MIFNLLSNHFKSFKCLYKIIRTDLLKFIIIKYLEVNEITSN